MTLTAKGQQLTTQQQTNAARLIGIGKQLNAPTVAIQACIFDAIFESDLGLNNGWDASNPGYGGILAGNISYFGQLGAADSVNVTNAEARSFYLGGNGYQAGGAIAAARSFSDPSLLGPQVTAPFDNNNPPPYGQYLHQGGLALIQQVKAEAIAIVGNVGALSGGIVGTNQVSPSLWYVGDEMNPDEDYWTCINRYGQSAQWYVFSDGEALYVADGIQLMGQTPANVIRLYDPLVVEAHLTYDNTAFQATHTSVKRGKTIRKATLARTTSPTECEVKIICPIDAYRGGDLVMLLGFGVAADGPWLVGEARRSIFEPYTTLTLVQGMAPINAVTGLPLGPAFISGPGASKPGAGTVMDAMLSAAAAINNFRYPYVHDGGRQQAGTPDIGKPGGPGYNGQTTGFDCSGAVAAVLYAGGLWSGPAYNIVADMLAKETLLPGVGNGSPECTIFQSPNHMFMRLNHVDWGTGDGRGHGASDGQSGPGWIYDGLGAGDGYVPYHVPSAILGQQAPTGNAALPNSTSGTGMVFPLPTTVAVPITSWTQDAGVDIATIGAACGSSAPLFAVGSGTVISQGLPGFGPDAPVLQLDTPLAGQSYVYYGHSGPTGAVAIGTHVAAGAQIGSVGCGIVGISTGPHLEIGFCDGSGNPVAGTAPTMFNLLKTAFGG